jgi:multisubunit Na+/H+ antiporter MnhG subunit
LIAFAVSLLIAWAAADWWLLLPIFMIAAGAYYVFLGALSRPPETGRRSYANGVYNIFWGGTILLLGVIWFINREYPDNVPLLVAIFIIWVGAVAVALSLPRFRRKSVQ